MKDFTNLIERVVEVEAALGIKLSALSAFVDDDNDLKVYGEAIFTNPPTEDNCATVNVVTYDDQGRIVGKEESYIGSKGLPFDVFDFYVYDIARPIARIKIFLKKA
jgi:hypothetical protein